MRLFFTLYILSIFTHEMYMIGMHIIFLLTNSFNKALSICCTRLSVCLIATQCLQERQEEELIGFLQSATRGQQRCRFRDGVGLKPFFKIKEDKVSFSSV